MIKLVKSVTPPQILIDRQAEWTKALLDEIGAFGSYSKIPSKLKEKLTAFYKHPEIKKNLFTSSNEKCAFCESKPAESGNIEVEHFAPKSVYPEKTFEWENLLPACRKCNESKDTHDTIIDPIINPYIDDPSDYIQYDYLEINAIRDTPFFEKTDLTIRVCDLNATRLILARSNILILITGYINQLKTIIHEIETSTSEVKRRNRIKNLRNSLELAQRLTLPNEKYSGYCLFILNSNETYQRAIELVGELETTNA